MNDDNPYEPGSATGSPPEVKVTGWQRSAPALGCGMGGCLVPFLFLLFCAYVFHDTGGPLIWPIFAGLCGIVGLGTGLIIKYFAMQRAIRRSMEEQYRAENDEPGL